MNKKIIFIFFLILIFTYQRSFAVDECETKKWYELYECRSTNICEPYKTNKVVYNTKKFKEAWEYENDNSSIWDFLIIWESDKKVIKKAIWNYKENMNNIYKCALINTQINSINLVKEELLNLDKVWDLKKIIEPKIESMISKLQMTFKSTKCSNIDEWVYNKINILNQTTYETCKYNFYMEYLKDYYSDINHVLWTDLEESEQKDIYVAKDVAWYQESIINSLNAEIQQAYKVFPIAFNAYSEYENNYLMHFLLTIIREDFIVFRDKLYKVLNPINQVVYKISNAMNIK